MSKRMKQAEKWYIWIIHSPISGLGYKSDFVLNRVKLRDGLDDSILSQFCFIICNITLILFVTYCVMATNTVCKE